MGKPTVKTNAAAPIDLEAALAVIASHEEAIAEQNKVIAEQNAHISTLEVKVENGSTKPTVTIGKKTYTIASGARVNGVTYTPQELAENTDAASDILDIEGQTVLMEEE